MLLRLSSGLFWLVLAAPLFSAEVKPASPRDAAVLASKLASPLPAVRISAAEGLGQMGAPAVAAVPALIKALNDDEVVVRNHAAWALGRIKGPIDQIVPALFARIAASDEQWSVRHNAALSLSWIGQPAVATLRQGLTAKEVWARAYTASALLRIGTIGDARQPVLSVVNQLMTEDNASLRSFAARLVPLVGDGVGELVGGLTKLLDDPDTETRLSAIQSLPKTGKAGAAAVPRVLVTLKDDTDQWVRIGAASALGEIGRTHPATIGGLIAALGDAKERVGVVAMQTVATFGEPAVPALLEALKSEKPVVKKYAVDALGEMGAKAGTKAQSVAQSLVPLLRDDKDYEMRLHAAIALGCIGVRDANVMGVLKTALSDENEIVRVNARDALKKLESGGV